MDVMSSANPVMQACTLQVLASTKFCCLVMRSGCLGEQGPVGSAPDGMFLNINCHWTGHREDTHLPSRARPTHGCASLRCEAAHSNGVRTLQEGGAVGQVH